MVITGGLFYTADASCQSGTLKERPVKPFSAGNSYTFADVFEEHYSKVGWTVDLLSYDKRYGPPVYEIKVYNFCNPKKENCKKSLIGTSSCSDTQSCAEPSIWLKKPKTARAYYVTITCLSGKDTSLNVKTKTYSCDSDYTTSSSSIPQKFRKEVQRIQKLPYIARDTESIYDSDDSLNIAFVSVVKELFERGGDIKGGSDCLDRALYLMYYARDLGLTSHIVIWKSRTGGSGHATVLVNGEHFDTTGKTRDNDYYYKKYTIKKIVRSLDGLRRYI